MKTKKTREKTDRIALLADILARLANSETSLGVSDFGREFAKNKGYIHHLLSSLESIGWVAKDSVSQKYKVGYKLFNFGLSVISRFTLTKITFPYLYELSDITNETTALCMRIGYERVYIQEMPAKHDNQQTVKLGQRYPIWQGAAGKAMVAFLTDMELQEMTDIMKRELPARKESHPLDVEYQRKLGEIKKRGYAITLADYRPDVCVLAAPIFDRTRAVIGSLIVRGKSPAFSPKIAEKYGPVILEITSKINREIDKIT